MDIQVQLAMASDFDSQVAGSSNDSLQKKPRKDGEDGDVLQPELEGGKDPYPICCMRLKYVRIINPINLSHSWIGKYIPIPWIKLVYETWGCFTT